MWEEECESIRVRHRRVSEVPARDDGGSESDEEHTDKLPLLSLTEEPPSDAPSQPMKPKTRWRQTRPESLFLDDDTSHTRLVLSNWGQTFAGANSDLPTTQPCLYGMLSAERPHYRSQALSLAENFAKAAGNSKPVPLRWDSPDFRVLYRFNSASEYQSMIKDLRDGHLREVKVKGERLRAVTLEPVRVINANLKCVVEMIFPFSINKEIKSALKPVFDHVAISQRFIFIPSNSLQQLGPIEETDVGTTKKYPPLLISLITNQARSSTARKILGALNKPQWRKFPVDVPVDPNSPLPFKHDEVYTLTKHSSYVPLASLTVGQAGSVMQDSIRMTVFCNHSYGAMVRFYTHILQAEPATAANYVIFSLMTEATSVLELSLYDSPMISTHHLDQVTLHFFIPNMALLVANLLKEFGSDISRLSRGVWHLHDPCGNKVTIHDRDLLTVVH